MESRIDLGALEELARSAELHDVMDAAGQAVAQNARNLAPGEDVRAKREGILAQTEMGPDGWESHVGHVVGSYGFWFARNEFGTRYQRPRPHLRPASKMRIRLRRNGSNSSE